MLHDSQLHDVELTMCIIEVEQGAIEIFLDDFDFSDYDLIILMGVAGDAPTHRIEVLARDIKVTTERPSVPCPKTLLTTMNMSQTGWADHLHRYSYDAGAYYCNYLYYRVLDTIYGGKLQRMGRWIPAVFVHVAPFYNLPLDEGFKELQKIVQQAMDSCK